jgi:hypothetical protein
MGMICLRSARRHAGLSLLYAWLRKGIAAHVIEELPALCHHVRDFVSHPLLDQRRPHGLNLAHMLSSDLRKRLANPRATLNRSKRTMTECPFLRESVAVSNTALATSSTVFAGSPLSFHFSEYSPVIYVGVKNGATTLTRTESSFAFRCDARQRPTTPCFDAI